MGFQPTSIPHPGTRDPCLTLARFPGLRKACCGSAPSDGELCHVVSSLRISRKGKVRLQACRQPAATGEWVQGELHLYRKLFLERRLARRSLTGCRQGCLALLRLRECTPRLTGASSGFPKGFFSGFFVCTRKVLWNVSCTFTFSLKKIVNSLNSGSNNPESSCDRAGVEVVAHTESDGVPCTLKPLTHCVELP